MIGAVCGRLGANAGGLLLGAHAGLTQTGGHALALSIPACGAQGLNKQARFSPPFTASATALRPSDPTSPRHSSDCSSATFAERISSGNCASTSSLGGSPCGPYFSHPPFVLDARSSSGLSPLASSGSTQLGRGGYRIRRRSRRRPLSPSLHGLRGSADGLGARLTPRSLGSNAWPGAWLLFGLSASGLAVADASTAEDSGDVDDEWCSVSSCGGAATTTCHAKDVLTNYRRIGVRGDGRCLFRAVAYGHNMQERKGAQDSHQDEQQADLLRNLAMDELERRRRDSEWFIEGDFDRYVHRMRHPGVWGGEPELLMLSHALRKPITVYIPDSSGAGIISIAEYGQEYGKEPIAVLYNGSSHYDALLVPAADQISSRL